MALRKARGQRDPAECRSSLAVIQEPMRRAKPGKVTGASQVCYIRPTKGIDPQKDKSGKYSERDGVDTEKQFHVNRSQSHPEVLVDYP